MANYPLSPFSFPLLSTVFALSLYPEISAAPATNTPVPPLQWIEITDSLSGSGPPGLSYASIGYDPDSSTLVIFGGESNNFPQQQTYLLNTNSLSWSSPSPLVQADVKPPPRSMAISGRDFAASNRHGFVVIGGKGQSDEPLSDAWEYDFNNQFWTNISISEGGPSPRYNAAGGTDLTASTVQDPTVAGPNNTFYIAGGFDGQNALSLSNVWKFLVAGVQSSNNVDDVVGSWTRVEFSDELPSRVRQGGTVMPSAMVVAAGGCSSDDTSDNTCAQQDSVILNVNATRDISPDGCPAPRVGPVIVPNFNAASSSFSKQAFMLLGTFNDTLWDDGNGLNRSEVAILDIDTGVWTRIIPSGDPSSGSVKYPTPREGAAAFSYSQALVGGSSEIGSDILVFGGKDADGNYLSDVWILRGYQGQLTSSNATWSGFGDGNLESGVNASGTGVTVQYLTSCAQTRTASATSSASVPSSTSTSTPDSPNSPNPGPTITFPYDTATSHKVTSPVSVALLLGALVFYRMSTPSTPRAALLGPNQGLVWLAALTGLAAYVVGIIGVVVAFTSITSTTNNALRKRAPSGSFLKTNHGKAALAFFIVLYGLIPLLFLVSFWRSGEAKDKNMVEPEPVKERERQDSNEASFVALMTPAREKFTSGHRATASSPDITSNFFRQESPSRTRTRSIFGGYFWQKKERVSTESAEPPQDEFMNSPGPSRSFEVLNRGNRLRRLSAAGSNLQFGESGHNTQSGVPRSLSDLDWLNKRHNVAAFGDLDYALTQLNRAKAATPLEGVRPPTTEPPAFPRPILPPPQISALHVLLHAAILAICIVTLVQLWDRAPKAAFAVFLAWTIAFYCIIFFLSWRGMPRASILSVMLSSLRYHPPPPPSADSDPSSRAASRSGLYAFPTDSRSPYTFHQPPVRRAVSTQEDDLLSSSAHGYPRSDDYDEDEETQQRRIEEEMARRDVSIVTVPRRKLWIANPS